MNWKLSPPSSRCSIISPDPCILPGHSGRAGSPYERLPSYGYNRKFCRVVHRKALIRSGKLRRRLPTVPGCGHGSLLSCGISPCLHHLLHGDCPPQESVGRLPSEKTAAHAGPPSAQDRRLRKTAVRAGLLLLIKNALAFLPRCARCKASSFVRICDPPEASASTC